MQILIIAQIITSFSVVLWFDLLKVNQFLLYLLSYKQWVSKVEMRKPWHRVIVCYFCTSFWLGVIASIILYLATGDLVNSILLIMSNSVASRVLDHLLGYKSYK